MFPHEFLAHILNYPVSPEPGFFSASIPAPSGSFPLETFFILKGDDVGFPFRSLFEDDEL